MNPNSSERTLNERFAIKRLADRVCEALVFYRPENQALAWIATTQTMQDGVCNKALRRGEAQGYSERNLRYGIHGRRLKGKTEYPGLLARKVIYVTGGYPKGGLAPNGRGLTPSYAIDYDVLLTFFPSGMDETPKGTQKGTQKGTLSSAKEKGTQRAAHVPASFPSSSFPSSSGSVSSTRAVSDPQGKPSPQRGEAGERIVVDVGGANAISNDVPIYPPESGADAPRGHKGAGNKERGEDQIIAQLEQVFDWVEAQRMSRGIDRRPLRAVGVSLDDIQLQDDAVFRTTPKQCSEVVDMCRARGSEKILTMFEEFLVTVNHAVNSSDDSPQHSHILRMFITWVDRQFKKENLMRQADRRIPGL